MNDFSDINNDNLKEYLILRNDLKDKNNKSDGYTYYNNKYDFEYKSITYLEEKNLFKVDLDVTETFNYNLPNCIGEEAITKNKYEIYLSKEDENCYIVSANIDTDSDPVDGEFNINKELGIEHKTRSKRSLDEKEDAEYAESNLSNIRDRLNEIERNIPNKNAYMNPPDGYRVYRSISSENISYSQRETIRSYAQTYAFRRNPNYLSFDSNCANFASQALRKAGARAERNHKIYIDGRDRSWSLYPDSFHIQNTYGDAWAQAHYLRAFITRNEGGSYGPGGHAIKYGSKLSLGDLCFLHNGERYFHTYIVVRPGSNFGVASNTKDRYNTPINEAGKIPSSGNQYERSYIHLATLN